MDNARRVSFARTRRLFLLLGELDELRERPDALRLHLTTGLLALIPAQVVIVGALEVGHGGEPSLRGIAEGGWTSDAERGRVRAFFERHQLTADPLARVLTSVSLERAQVFTARRRDVLTRTVWHESAFFQEARRPNGADDAIYSVRAPSRDGEHARMHREALGLTRAAGDRPFTEEDRDLAHLAHLGLSRVLDSVTASGNASNHTPMRDPLPPADAMSGATSRVLSPREHETLESLLHGRSDKEIAVELGIGRNTVNKHVMAIFRAYHVTSRARLIARVLGERLKAP